MRKCNDEKKYVLVPLSGLVKGKQNNRNMPKFRRVIEYLYEKKKEPSNRINLMSFALI
jgi:hypothetical protein